MNLAVAAPQEIATAAGGPAVSIVIPCYRSTDALDTLVDGLVAVMGARAEPFEIVLVDDGSPDETWARLAALKRRHGAAIRALRLAGNVGQHVALISGFAAVASSARIVVTMDDDGQHPPDALPPLLDALDAGADLVIAAYDRAPEPAWRLGGGAMVDRALRRIFGLPRDFQLTSLRAFRRYLADNAVEMRTDFPYVTAMLLGGTQRRRNVLVRHVPRRHGQSGYGFVKSLRLALNLYFTFSKVPLYVVLGLAGFSFAMTTALGSFAVIATLLNPDRPAGWASIVAAVSFGNSILLACFVVFGVYVSRFHRTLSGIGARYRVAAEL